MTEKMKGILTQLKTYNDKGQEIASEYTFKPFCEWYIENLRDGYACTTYSLGAILDEFGLGVTMVVTRGEMVEVEREVPEGFSLVSCPASSELIKTKSRVRYPVPGEKEYLIRKYKD